MCLFLKRVLIHQRTAQRHCGCTVYKSHIFSVNKGQTKQTKEGEHNMNSGEAEHLRQLFTTKHRDVSSVCVGYRKLDNCEHVTGLRWFGYVLSKDIGAGAGGGWCCSRRVR